MNFRKDKLNHLSNGRDFDIVAAIDRAFAKIPLLHIQKCIEHSLKVMRANIE